MKTQPILSIVVGTYNRLPFLKLTIESIRRDSANITKEIIVVDGSSTDGSLEYLTRQKDIITIVQHNRGEWNGKPVERRSWGYFMNLGFKVSRGKYICMLSDDCLLVPGALQSGFDFFESTLQSGHKVGAVAFQWRNWPEQKEYGVTLTLGNKMLVNHGLYLREAMQDVGYCDEISFKFYHADADLCLRMWQKGYEVLAAPDSYVEHYSHANMQVRKLNGKLESQDWAVFLTKWTGVYYNPEQPQVGGRLSKAYVDPACTWRALMPFARKPIYLIAVRFMWRIRNGLKWRLEMRCQDRQKRNAKKRCQ